MHKHRKRGRRKGGGQPPIILEAGQHALCPLPPPPGIHPHFVQGLCAKSKTRSQKYQVEGLNVIYKYSFILFEGIGKRIPFNSILKFAILSEFKMRNVIIWHCFIIPCQ